MKFDIIDILLIAIIGMLVGILGFMIVNLPTYPDLSGELEECREVNEDIREDMDSMNDIIQNQRDYIIEITDDCGK